MSAGDVDYLLLSALLPRRIQGPHAGDDVIRAGNAKLPTLYLQAQVAIKECNRVDECKDWADKAQAMASYAKQSKNKDMLNMAMRIQLRATRRCGQLLEEFEKQQGGDRKSKGRERPFDRKTAANEAGMSPRQAKTAIRVARVNGDDFDKQVDADNPPTRTALADQGRRRVSPLTEFYVARGITAKAYNSGMCFRGSLVDLVKATIDYDPQDVVVGSHAQERKEMLGNMKIIETHFDKIRKLL